MNGVPGIILAASVALAALNGYINKREELAVSRAGWRQTRDSLRNVIVSDELAAHARDKQRNDSIAALNRRLTQATKSAAVAGQAFTVTLAALRATADSGTAAALDSLEAQHSRQVLSLQQALAASQEETRIANEKVVDRDAQLLTLRGNLTNAITRADNFEKQAHPGAIKRVLDSPVTHLVAFGAGYLLGAK